MFFGVCVCFDVFFVIVCIVFGGYSIVVICFRSVFVGVLFVLLLFCVLCFCYFVFVCSVYVFCEGFCMVLMC